MLRIKIKDVQAFHELQEAYGVSKVANLQNTIRKTAPKLLREDDIIEYEFPVEFLAKSYQYNPQAFVQHLKLSNSYKIWASGGRGAPTVKIRLGYEAPSFAFAKNLTAELHKEGVKSVDVLIADIPKAYYEQIYHLLNRLSKRICFKIEHLVLGDTIRFIKTKTPVYTTPKTYV